MLIPWAQHWCRLPQEAFLDAQLASVMTQRLLVPGLPLPGGHVGVRRLGARHGQQPGAQNRDGEASLRSQNQTRSGGAHSAEKMLRLEERAWRGLSPRVLGRALR